MKNVITQITGTNTSHGCCYSDATQAN